MRWKRYGLVLVGMLISLVGFAQGVVLLPEDMYRRPPSTEERRERMQLPNRCVLPSPPPGHQGSLGNCTAWATAYAGMGVLYQELWSRNWTVLARSPLFVYSHTAPSCDGGVNFGLRP